MKKYWNLFILILSIYVVIELSIEIIYTFSFNTQKIIDNVDIFISLVFLLDFFVFLYLSDNKKKYIKNHCIDFISSLPFVGILRALRIVKVIRLVKLLKVLKVLKGVKGIMPILNFINKTKSRSILVSYSFILIVIIFYCSLAFYSFECNVNENVNTFFDAIWWSFVTVTSVGYGDISPITTESKIIAMVLTILGMGLFSLITAEISTNFIKINNKN